jgi:hypothetical protein
MALNMTTADSALKEDYQPAIREQLNNAVMLLAQIEKNTTDVEGRRAVLSLHVSRNSGIGARADGGALPTAGNQGYAEERVLIRHNYGRLQVSGPVMRAMKSDTGSFVRAVDSESRGLVNDLKRDVNRQVAGTSDGVIITCGTSGASTTVTLPAATTVTQMRQLENGMVIDIGTIANPVLIADARTISAVNRSAKTFVVSGAAVTTSSSHFIFRAGNGGGPGTTGAGQKELTGLRTIVAGSGILFNIDPATYASWVSYTDTSGGIPNDVKFEVALDNIKIEGGEDANLIMTTNGVSRAYGASLQSQKRFQNTLDLKGGFKAISVTTVNGEVGLTWDRDVPEGYAFVLNTEHLKEHVSSDWEFMDKDGAVLSRVVGYDAYEATLFKDHELTTDKRNAHGVLTGLTEA